jgi:CDP-diacylglycerol--glycerol-3-phosphate 3-phosphatidyltransferase
MQFKDIPNIITLFRIITIPIIIVTFYFDDLVFAHRLGALLFAIASLSDFFDGYIARKFNIVSGFGKMFDPIADKVLVGTVLLMLVKFRKIEVLPCILILAREFVVSGLREFLAEIKVSVPVSTLGKIKTFVQMGSITLLLLGSKGSGIESLDFIGQILLWSAALLTIVSSYSYLKASKDYM